MFERAGSETGRSYQTHAGDAGVVGDVGDVEDFSFVLTAGLGTCGGRQEEGGGEKWKCFWTLISPPESPVETT